MSEVSCDIRYNNKEHLHSEFQQILEAFSRSPQTDIDKDNCIKSLNRIGVDGSAIFGESRYWEARFSNPEENRFIW